MAYPFGLLCARAKWPWRRRAAEKRDELAPLHVSRELTLFSALSLRLRLVGEKDTQLNAHSSVGAMSALGQKQTCAAHKLMSALPPIADMCGAARDVRFVPIADIRSPYSITSSV